MEDQRIKLAAKRSKIDQRRARLTGRIERLTDMMADGIGKYDELKGRLKAALAERESVNRELKEAEAVPEIALHPGIADAYRRNIEKLSVALGSSEANVEVEAEEARLALRNLIEVITASPNRDGRGVDLLVHGRLAQILAIANNRPDLSPDGCMFDLVAGTASTKAFF